MAFGFLTYLAKNYLVAVMMMMIEEVLLPLLHHLLIQNPFVTKHRSKATLRRNKSVL